MPRVFNDDDDDSTQVFAPYFAATTTMMIIFIVEAADEKENESFVGTAQLGSVVLCCERGKGEIKRVCSSSIVCWLCRGNGKEEDTDDDVEDC